MIRVCSWCSREILPRDKPGCDVDQAKAIANGAELTHGICAECKREVEHVRR